MLRFQIIHSTISFIIFLEVISMKQAHLFSMIHPCTKIFMLECILIPKIQALIKSEDSNYTFIFDTSCFTPNSDNAKNKAIFKFKIDEGIRIYVLNNKEELQDLPNVFKQNSAELSDDFLKALKNAEIKLKEEEIKKNLNYHSLAILTILFYNTFYFLLIFFKFINHKTFKRLICVINCIFAIPCAKIFYKR